MGQAKSRGPFEIRKVEGEQRIALELAKKKEQDALYEASLTPEQRKKRDSARKQMALLLSIADQFAGQFRF
jgi:hypothetical protein